MNKEQEYLLLIQRLKVSLEYARDQAWEGHSSEAQASCERALADIKITLVQTEALPVLCYKCGQPATCDEKTGDFVNRRGCLPCNIWLTEYRLKPKEAR